MLRLESQLFLVEAPKPAGKRVGKNARHFFIDLNQLFTVHLGGDGVPVSIIRTSPHISSEADKYKDLILDRVRYGSLEFG